MIVTFFKKIAKKVIIFAIPFVRVYWHIFKPKTYGVKVVIFYNEKILCIKNSYYKGWSFVGGGIKRKEKPSETARRETKEEVGLKLINTKYLGSFMSEMEGKRDTIYVFSGYVNTEKFKIDDFEVDTAKWFLKKDLPEFGPVAKEVWSMFEKNELQKK